MDDLFIKRADSIAEFMEEEICYMDGQGSYEGNRQSTEQHNAYQRVYEYLLSASYPEIVLSKMIDLVSKIKLSERKEQFLIDKLCTYGERYPKVKNDILKLL